MKELEQLRVQKESIEAIIKISKQIGAKAYREQKDPDPVLLAAISFVGLEAIGLINRGEFTSLESALTFYSKNIKANNLPFSVDFHVLPDAPSSLH